MAVVGSILKEVKLFHMDAPNETLPDGFVICDGTTLGPTQQDINPGGNYTVPNLLGFHPLFADPTKSAGQAGVAVGNAAINTAAGAPGPKGITGENQHILVTGEMPAHTHPLNIPTHSSNVGSDAVLQNDRLQQGTYNNPTGSVGSNNPHENRPRSYGLVPIMKVKN